MNYSFWDQDLKQSQCHHFLKIILDVCCVRWNNAFLWMTFVIVDNVIQGSQWYLCLHILSFIHFTWHLRFFSAEPEIPGLQSITDVQDRESLVVVFNAWLEDHGVWVDCSIQLTCLILQHAVWPRHTAHYKFASIQLHCLCFASVHSSFYKVPRLAFIGMYFDFHFVFRSRNEFWNALW